MPVNRRVLTELVVHHQPEWIALADPEFRAGHGAVISPDSGVRVAVASQVDDRLLRGESVFLDFGFRETTAQWEREPPRSGPRAHHEGAS